MPILGSVGAASAKGFGLFQGKAPILTYVSLSTNAHAAATSITINAPTSITPGNLLVAYICHRDATYAQRMSVLPSGWTQGSLTPTSTTATTGSLISYYKIAGASEPASYTWSGSSVSRAGTGVILNYIDGGWDASSKSVSYQVFSSPYNITMRPDPTSITVGANKSILIFVGASEDSGKTMAAPSGYSTYVSQVGGASQQGAMWVFYKEDVSAGNSGTPSTILNSSGQGYVLLNSIKPD